MGLLKNFKIFEEVYEPGEVESYSDSLPDVPEVEVVTEHESVDTLVSDIYSNNALGDMEHSIFKVEDVIKTLPEEMKLEVKRETVKSILNSFGLNPATACIDGIDRIELIQRVKDELQEDHSKKVAELEGLIEEEKQKIQDMEKEIFERENDFKKSSEKLDDELSRVGKLVEFIKEGE